ncbi:MAG: YdcF family protein [Thermoanaerobaculia bacterium]
MNSIGIVCGYDRFEDLHLYVEHVVQLITADPVDAVILTGGFTSPSSWHSEAWLMASVLSRLLPRQRVLIEEQAMTTLDNLVFAKSLAHRIFGRIPIWKVYCDAAHRMKVGVLSRIILGKHAQVFAVEREVELHIRLVEPFSVVLESICAHVPGFQRMLSAFSARMKGVSGTSRRSILRDGE